MIEFKLGQWLPDVADLKNPGLEVCTNVIPGPGGYQPAPGLGDAVATVGASVLSAAMFERADGTRVTVCATAADLHVIIGGTVTPSGLTLALTAPVSFVRFGASIYATEENGGTWWLDDIETDTAFAAATWTTPRGKSLARVGDFLFMGNLKDTDSSDAPYRIRWSPFNNPQGNWATDIGLQSDAVDMPTDFGPVMAIAGWTFGLILQRYGVSRIQYTGGASVFAKDVVDKERGCAATRSVVAVGDRVYFLSDDGFCFSDGGPAQPISRGRMWTWFLNRVGQNYFNFVQGAADWTNRCVIWTVPDENGTIQGLLYYNWETDWWSFVEAQVDCLFASGRDGLTLEQVAAIYPNLDTMPVSLDDPSFRAKGRSVAAFKAGVLSQLAGEPLEALFTTGEFQIAPGARSFVSAVTPLITNADESTTVSLGGRDRQIDVITYSADTPMGPLGFAPVNFDARYFRVSIKIPPAAAWTDAYGFQIEATTSGAH